MSNVNDAMDFEDDQNNLTVSLMAEVLKSCDHTGSACLPGCQEAIDAVKATGRPSFSSERNMEYLFYILVHRNIRKYDGFVSGMRSCNQLPVADIDSGEEKVNMKETQVAVVYGKDVCVLGSGTVTLTWSGTPTIIIALLVYFYQLI